MAGEAPWLCQARGCDPQGDGCSDRTTSDTALMMSSVGRSRTLTAVLGEYSAVCAAVVIVVRITLVPEAVERRPPTVKRVVHSTNTTAKKHLHGNKPAFSLRAIIELYTPSRPSTQPHRRLETLVTVHAWASWALPPRLCRQHQKTDLISPDCFRSVSRTINATPAVPDGLQADPLLPLMDNRSAHQYQAGKVFRRRAAHRVVVMVCRKHSVGCFSFRLHATPTD